MPIIKTLNIRYLYVFLVKMRCLYIADRPGDGDIKAAIFAKQVLQNCVTGAYQSRHGIEKKLRGECSYLRMIVDVLPLNAQAFDFGVKRTGGNTQDLRSAPLTGDAAITVFQYF